MAKTLGKVYIVGAGPGHPDLLTLRALHCLKNATVVLHDRLIATEYLAEWAPKAKLIDVGKKASYHTLPQDEIEAKLIALAKAGQTVVRLKGGDPFIFGRGGEECQALRLAGVPFEVVPGISSALAVPLYAGIPLTHRKFTSGITIVTGHENPNKEEIPYRSGVERGASIWVDWPAVAKMGTIVFLMGVGNLRANMEKLREHGKASATPVAVIRWGSLGKQRKLIGTIATIADQVQRAELKAPAIVVVGEVVSLHKEVSWFEHLPLFGQNIIITRSPSDNMVLRRLILERGGHAITLPSFTVASKRLTASEQRQVKGVKGFDWMVFTSEHAVTAFLNAYDKSHDDRRALASVKIAAVGPKTAEALRAQHLWVDAMPKQHNAAGLLTLSVFAKKRGLKILLPQAKDARPELQEGLRKRHSVTVIVTYAKRLQRWDQKMRDTAVSKPIDWVTFFSPSAVASFAKQMPKNDLAKFLKHTKAAVIGHTTRDALKELGWQHIHVARRQTQEHLLELMRS